MPPAKQPRYRYIWYGDGEWALELEKTEKRNEEGIEGWEFKLQPSTDIIARYNLRQRGLIDKYDHATRWYPKSRTHVLDDSPTRGRIFIQTDFFGQDTHFSRIYANYTETIENLQRIVNALRANNARLTRELRLLTGNEMQFWNERVELIKKIKETSATKSPFEGFGDQTQDMSQQ